MLLLRSTSSTLQLTTSGATSTDWSAAWNDIGANGVTFQPGSAEGNLAASGSNTIAPAPASTITRQIKAVTVVNRDNALTQTVTVQILSGAGTINVSPATTLSPGEMLQYIDTEGWVVLSVLGQIKTVGSPGPQGGTGAIGPAVFLEAEPGEQGDFTPGVQGTPGGTGPAGNAGPAGPTGPATYLEAEPGEQGDFAPGIQGTPGATGLPGATGPAVYLDAEPGEQGDLGPPGAPGAQGVTGNVGPTGPAVFLDAEPGEQGDFAPGVQGSPGAPGLQGSPGPAVFLEAEPGEQGDFVPGPQGTAGAPGVQSVSYLNANISPDTHPLNPTAFDDEFEGQSGISAAWASHLSSGATLTTALAAGSYMQTNGGIGTLVLQQALPGTPFEFTIKTALGVSPDSSWGVGLTDNSTGKTLQIALFGGDGNIYAQRGTFNTSTWVYTFGANPANNFAAYTFKTSWIYLKVAYDGTTISLSFSPSGIPNSFSLLWSETAATWVASPSHVSLCLGAIASSSFGAAVDWFRNTTAPYVPSTYNTGIGPAGPAIFLEAEPGEEGGFGPPGLPGTAGAPGATGSVGPQGPAIFLDAEPGEQGDFGLPGPTGAQGVTGAQGPVGPATNFLGEDPVVDHDLWSPARNPIPYTGLVATGDGLSLLNPMTQTVAASAAINNTETYICTPLKFLANQLLVGQKFLIRGWGTCTSTVANLSTFTPRLGSAGTTADTALSLLTCTAATSGTAVPFNFEIEVVIRATGVSGSAFMTGRIINNGITGISSAAQPVVTVGAAVTINTTGALQLGVSYKSAATTTTSTFQNVSVAQID